ncbi:hypothetical protein ACVWVX_000127 [Ewingella americana]
MSANQTKQDPIQFAYWVPNVSGGLVISNIPQAHQLGYRL